MNHLSFAFSVCNYYKNINKLDARVVTEFIEYITISEKNREKGNQTVNIKWRF